MAGQDRVVLEQLVAAAALVQGVDPNRLDEAGRVQLALVCSTTVLARMLAENPLGDQLEEFAAAARRLADSLDRRG